jgi:SAM-dependent methyltransferase
MTGVPTLFDPAAHVLRADRAARLWPRGDFLHRRAAEGLAERLGDVARDWPQAAVFGSGGGAYAEALAETGRIGRLVQAEPSAGLAAQAAAFGETMRADGPGALPPASLDLVLGGLGLHRENDPVGWLVQARLALKPDGLFLGATLGGQTLHELRACLAEAEVAVEGGLSPRVSPMADLRDLGGLLQRAGFAMPVADVDRLVVDYADALALMRDLRALGETNTLADRRRRFTRRETLLRAAALYAQHFARADGRVTATFDIVFLSGWAPGPGQPVAKRPGSATARLADALGTQERPAGEKAGG